MNRMILMVPVAALALIAGCDSLVGGPCASGYVHERGACVAGDGLGDAGPGGGGDGGGGGGDAGAGPDALVCTAPELPCNGACLDVTSNPSHCGACNHPCSSGICTNGTCSGGLPGHVIGIGHDYRSYHLSMARVLGNAVALGMHVNVGVVRYRGTSVQASSDGTTNAITQAMVQIGRQWHAVALPATPSPGAFDAADVLIIEAQTGDGNAAQAAAVPWVPAVDRLLQRGGVAVVLEGAGGVSYRFAAGAGLFTLAPPIDVTGQSATVTNPGDALAAQVFSPYAANTSSVRFPGALGAVVTAAGAPVVFHTVRE